MKLSLLSAFVFGCSAAALAEQAQKNPLGTVISLLDDLTAKVTKEGEAEAKAYKDYMEWCDDTVKETDFAIKTAADEKQKLEAKIGELTSDIQAASSEIDELSGAVAKAEAEVKDATLIREKEAADFAKSDQELVEAIDMLGRAVGVLEKEMAKSGAAALAQVDSSSVSGMLQALGTVMEAAAFSTSDKQKLSAFVQSRQASEDDDGAPGAPAASTYDSHSGGIVEVLQDMKEKAESELSDLRKDEANAKHNYGLLKQSLEDQAEDDTKDLEAQKANRAAAQEAKATAEGDLEVTTKELQASREKLATTKSACAQVASDHEATVAARTEELKVIAEAKKALVDTSSGAVSQTYSFVQVAATMRTSADLARSEVVTMVRQLAKKQHSAALAQLASRLGALVRYGTSAGEDPFAKIKGLIMDMITKLEKEADEEATEKAYCDEQMAKTEAKKSELEEDIAKMTSKIDTAAAKSAELKEQIKELEAELAALVKEQAEMDKIRQEQHEDYETAKADLTLGLSGVRQALRLLRDYYGSDAASAAALLQGASQQPPAPELHSKAAGAGQSIVGILEVVESDFAKNLAKEETEEEDAQTLYDKTTQENKITKATKEQDVKYKTQEAKSADTTVADYSADRESASSELSAVLDYYAKIKDRCIAKPETYEERQRRRQAEIAGLKEALAVLKEETALVQRRQRRSHGHFRGSLSAEQ